MVGRVGRLWGRAVSLRSRTREDGGMGSSKVDIYEALRRIDANVYFSDSCTNP